MLEINYLMDLIELLEIFTMFIPVGFMLGALVWLVGLGIQALVTIFKKI